MMEEYGFMVTGQRIQASGHLCLADISALQALPRGISGFEAGKVGVLGKEDCDCHNHELGQQLLLATNTQYELEVMRMKVINKTSYQTRPLKNFFMGIARWRCADDVTRYVTVKYVRSYNCNEVHGVAYPSMGNIVMRLPREPDGRKSLTRVAQVFAHELDHVLGLNHKEMAMWTSIEVPPELIPDVLLVKQPKPKPTRDQVVRKRYDHVLMLVRKNEQKLKATKTRLSGLAKKQQYYERTYGLEGN